jgi:hypothetical protein
MGPPIRVNILPYLDHENMVAYTLPYCNVIPPNINPGDSQRSMPSDFAFLSMSTWRSGTLGL